MDGSSNIVPVSLSAGAVERLREILAVPEHAGGVLRITVDGGGCSGFAYGFAIESAINDDDLVIKKDGVTVVVDPVSLGFLDGAEIDYVNEMVGAAFKINNPNAISSCGCGNSFSVG